MTVALWCILAAMFIPYGFTIAAKSGPGFSNNTPRAYLDSLQTGWRQRAHWAQCNGFEAFPPFAAAVIVAHISAAPQQYADILALVFIIARIAYGLCYIADQASLRSLAWFMGVLSTVGLFIISA
jgi:uncharacterized MAPEG superfamily protein